MTRDASELPRESRVPADAAAAALELFRDHGRQFEQNRYVYPVVSRRSRGVSVGINLNPDRVCNFDCIYCQVDRRSESDVRFVELDQLVAELRQTLPVAASQELFLHEHFKATPPHLRRLNDIAFAGDGEPTTFRNFDDIVAACAAVRRELAAPDVRMVLITNASMFHRPHVQRGLAILDQNQGEIWGKLDAGTEPYYRLVDRTTIPFSQILSNLRDAAAVRPIVIQSLFMEIHGEPPARDEIDAWATRLQELTQGGGRISLVQVYTVARRPAESFVTPLTPEQLTHIADVARKRAGVRVEIYS